MGAVRKLWRTGIQLVGLRNIAVRRDLQCRAIENPQMVKVLAESLLEGNAVPPLVVFDTRESGLLLAEGFTRYEAHVRANKDQARCDVRKGTIRDAIIWSAGSNREHGAGPATMGAKDLRRAAEMLFADPDWLLKAAATVAEHIGAKSSGTILLWKKAWCVRNNVEYPSELVTRDGRRKPAERGKGRVPAIRVLKRSGQTVMRLGGRRYTLPRDPQEAIARRDQIVAEHAAQEEEKLRSLDTSAIRTFLGLRKILVEAPAAGERSGLGSCLLSSDSVIVAIDTKLEEPIAVRQAIATAILAQARDRPSGRMIIVRHDLRASEALDIAREKLGIEFMTPEELVESLKGAP